jgi:hypothetical protein
VLRWAGEPDARRFDLGLGARQPPLDCLLRDQERARDLCCRQAAERAQRERHLRLQRQGRMAAGEHQLEALGLGPETLIKLVH